MLMCETHANVEIGEDRRGRPGCQVLPKCSHVLPITLFLFKLRFTGPKVDESAYYS